MLADVLSVCASFMGDVRFAKIPWWPLPSRTYWRGWQVARVQLLET